MSSSVAEHQPNASAINLWSEGTRIAADLFLPEPENADSRHPAILLCHGWGGPKAHLSSTYAPYFCRAGFVCLTFDYRGWFESDARLATPEPQGEAASDGSLTVTGIPIRDVVDPLDQNRDIHNLLDWLFEHERVDPERVGLWGSSFGGGHVIHVAGTDARIAAVVSQVPGMGPAPGPDGLLTPDIGVQKLAAAMTRGELAIVPRPPEQPESLNGVGDFRTMWRYQPRVKARNIRAPTLIIDQEDEEYGGRENSGLAARNAIPDSTDVSYQVLPGSHYDVYENNYQQSARLARDWFVRHLSP
jgi:dienelactone hydrolase